MFYNNWRYYIIYGLLILLLMVLIFKISTLHVFKVSNNQTLEEKGINQTVKTLKITGFRGNILDRNSQVMAISLPLKNIVIDPEQLVWFLSADFLDKERDQFIAKFVKLLKKYPAISPKLFHKVRRSFALNSEEFKQKLGLKITFNKSSNPNLVKKTNQLLKAYLLVRTKAIFERKINAKIYLKIANTLQISAAALKTALLNTSSRKYLNIATNLDINNPIYKNTRQLLNKSQKILFSNGRFSERYFGGAILIDSHIKRFYPAAEANAALIGLVDTDNKGIEGLEKIYDNWLKGEDGLKQMAFSGDKKPYADIGIVKPAKQGKHLKLTIDNEIQHRTYAAIKHIVEQKKAKYGSAIVLNPQAEILAMVNYVSDKTAKNNGYSAETYRNRVLLDALETGSTIKPFIVLFGLQKNRIRADDVLELTSAIAHHKPDKYKQLSISQIIAKSHNLGILNINKLLSKEEIWQMMTNLGFGEISGALPTLENEGLLRHHSKWHLSDKYSLSFGYGPMNTTIAQLARAYLIFVNQGRITNLKLLKDDDKPEFRQVFNPAAIAAVVQMLADAASDKGSGYKAQISGYDVAGKTGTTRLKKINAKGYDDNRHSTFFVGFAPTNKTKYLMAVHIFDPENKYSSGANVAAPAFKLAMENILKFQ